MDAVSNPYAPGAGTRPPEMTGRDAVVDRVDIAFDRIRAGRHAKHHMLVGLRGVGKTVLLDHLHRRAVKRGFVCVKIEAPENRSLPALLVPQLRTALLRLDRGEAAAAGVKRAMGALRNFASAFKLKFGELEASIEAGEPGLADSGDLDTDLADLLASIGAAAASRKTAFGLFLDEIQYLREEELGALIGALHHATQASAPVAMVGAGLPQLAGLMGDAKSYSERMFRFEPIGPLDPADAAAALERPAAAQGVVWQADAVAAVFDVTCGYPYFLQEWGSQTWATATGSSITADDVAGATPVAVAELDESFFRVRLDRLTPKERSYLRAMAALSEEVAVRSSDVAERLHRTVGSVGPLRDALIKKCMIYSVGYGEIGFTVPLFGSFMRRAMAESYD